MIDDIQTYAAVAKPDDIARQWPDGHDAPQLILDVASYIADKPWMSLGATRMVGDRMDDHWIENGADLWRDFGCFMRLPDGSRVAQWFRDGDAGTPPIVLIGSEGEQLMLAPDIEAFLASWALGRFNAAGELAVGAVPVGLPSDLIRDDDNDEIADGRAAFAVFLTDRLGKDVASFVKRKPDDAPFVAFFDSWGKGARAEMAANANLQAMSEILDAHVPRGKEVWERESFRIAVIGDRIEIGDKGGPVDLLSEALGQKLRSLIAAERERRAGGVHAPRGLWNSAMLMLYPDGHCQLACDWSEKPEFATGGPVAAAEFAADQKRFPKADRWIEPWMRELR